jgi:hypothetical protein
VHQSLLSDATTGPAMTSGLLIVSAIVDLAVGYQGEEHDQQYHHNDEEH